MTGFGQGSADTDDLRVAVEMRGVNNRYTDLRFRMPPELAAKEPEMRRRLLKRVHRGRVEVNVRVERPGGSQPRPTLNQPLLEEVIASSARLSRDFGLKGTPDLIGVLSIPGMFRTEAMELEWTADQNQTVLRAFDEALDLFDADRGREGQALRVEIAGRIDTMKHHAAEGARLAPAVPGVLRDKLVQRLESLEGQVELDPARVAQEAAFLADRSDVTEELVRLGEHLKQAGNLLERPDGKPLGKRLEFLFQEIHRETNTVCSKSADLELTGHALAIKLEIEKTREQAQNLE